MNKKTFHAIWEELTSAGFFSLTSKTVMPVVPVGGEWDDLCRSLCDENRIMQSTTSFFERNLSILIFEKNGETRVEVSSSRPFYDKQHGALGSNLAFYGEGSTFESAITDLYNNFMAKPNAVKCKPFVITNYK